MFGREAPSPLASPLTDDDGSLVAHGALALGRAARPVWTLYSVVHGYGHGHVRCLQKATVPLENN
jgi:hypothetical protein